ncbi:MAG: pyridoxamine 5'-phosphate oxidase [Gammaproteobacteria bacterium]|nr:MAG: pyridoxamine 5'-phosphate oxidase [Gammaproteobacteria bacterium]
MNLESIRREYKKQGLSKNELNPSPTTQLSHWLTKAGELSLIDATAMNLATVDSSGQPSQRIVLLKDLSDKGLIFYTNLQSRKAQDIKNNHKVSVNFAWLPLERQVKIQGVATRLSVAENIAYFSTRPKNSQLAAWASNQSHPISSRKLLNHAFEQMKEKFKQGEIPVPDFWGGYLIKPTRFEFWQGGGSRLHDSFSYSTSGDIQTGNQRWTIQRLAP